MGQSALHTTAILLACWLCRRGHARTSLLATYTSSTPSRYSPRTTSSRTFRSVFCSNTSTTPAYHTLAAEQAVKRWTSQRSPSLSPTLHITTSPLIVDCMTGLTP